MPNNVDLTKNHVEGGWAVYLPAISSFYAHQLAKLDRDPNFAGVGRMPAGFENGHQGLNFLDPEKGYYQYKWGLYSAGHAKIDLVKSDNEEPMVQKRDRDKTIVVGDSGGYQIATGVMKVDWQTIQTPAGDQLRENILRWLEHTSDWSMTLDVPAFAATPPLSKKTGLTKFQDTLDVTEYNLHYFIKHRVPGKTKFLNVLSGSDIENGRLWYETVKHFSNPASVEAMGYEKERAFEGYAFAGINMQNMTAVLERFLALRDDGLLEGKDWVHFLGLGRLDWACFLTSIQRQLRKHYNPNITLSFDAASPFVSVAYGLAYNYNYFTTKKLTYSMDRAIDEKKFKNSKMAMPWQSPIMDRLNAGDICVLGDTDPNKNGKIGRTSWDTFSYMLIMGHNVYNHISAVQEINRLADIEHARYNANYKDWNPDKKSSMANELSQFVPGPILFFESFVTELFDPATKDPYQMLKDNRRLLDSISFGGTTNSTLETLFDVHKIDDIDKFANMNDEKLKELEDLLDGEA